MSAFVVLNLVSPERNQKIGWEKHLHNDLTAYSRTQNCNPVNSTWCLIADVVQAPYHASLINYLIYYLSSQVLNTCVTHL